DAGVRAAAAEALGRIGPAAKGAYPRMLHTARTDPDPAVVQAARLAADRVGLPSPGDVALLCLQLKDQNASFRASVAQTLLLIGPAAGDAPLGALAEALDDLDPRVRVFAAQAHYSIRKDPQAVLRTLTSALSDRKDAGVRAGAAYALGTIG